MRAVFMGTPELAVPTLEALVRSGHEVAAVFTQPDRPAGRGKRLTAPAVKRKAEDLRLPVFQPERAKAPEVLEKLHAIEPRVIVVVGYGQIIPQAIIDLPEFGCVNVHVSLLPKYRGAAPIQWAIYHGETVTGVTTMQIEKRLDAGDILLQREAGIGAEETAAELTARIAPAGAELLIDTLAGLEAGAITPRKQDDSQASYAPLIQREHGRIDWSRAARAIFNQWRAFDPWPGAYSSFRGKRLHIRRARRADGERTLKPSELRAQGEKLLAGCGDGALEIEQLQLEGKKPISAPEFVRGYAPRPGEKLGESTL